MNHTDFSLKIDNKYSHISILNAKFHKTEITSVKLDQRLCQDIQNNNKFIQTQSQCLTLESRVQQIQLNTRFCYGA